MCQAVNLRYYSVLISNDILVPATTGKYLEDIILSEMTPSQKDKYCDSTYLRCIEEAETPRDTRWTVGGEKGDGWLLFSHSVFSDSATPWTAACQASLSFTISRSLLKLMPTDSVMPSNHLILCHPLLLLPSIFPSIKVFSDKSALHIR